MSKRMVDARQQSSLFALALGAVFLMPACSEELTGLPAQGWLDRTTYPTIGHGKVLITNSGDDTLTWLDLDTLAPVFTEPVGRIPAEREGIHHGAVAGDGSAYFIGVSNYLPGSGSGPHGGHGTGTVSGYLLKYATATHELTGVVEVDRSPGDVRLTADGKYVLQSHFDLQLIIDTIATGGPIEHMNATLAIIDPMQMTATSVTAGLVAKLKVCPGLHGIRTSADSGVAYVACWGSDELAVVGLSPPYDVSTFHLGNEPIDPTAPSHAPYSVAVSPKDGSVWVSNLGRTGGSGADIRVFDAKAMVWDTTRGPISTGGLPFFGDFSADGALFLVPNQYSNTLSFIDADTGAITRTLDLPAEACTSPHAVLIAPDQKRALVVCEGDHVGPGSVVTVNIAVPLPAVASMYPVGVFPDDAILLRGEP